MVWWVTTLAALWRAESARPSRGTELETLMQLLDFLRATVATKATG